MQNHLYNIKRMPAAFYITRNNLKGIVRWRADIQGIHKSFLLTQTLKVAAAAMPPVRQDFLFYNNKLPASTNAKSLE